MGLFDRLFGSSTPVVEIDVATARTAAGDPEVQVVDCRWQREWNSGHIAGATLMPLNTIGKRMDELDPNRPVLVVCRSGHRSASAARKLTGAGFTDVRSLKGGMMAWSRAGNKVVS